MALAFTLAGFSVQTAKPSALTWLTVIEIAGWISLSVAGSIGLWRINKLWLREVGVANVEGGLFGSRTDDVKKDLKAIEASIRKFGKWQYAFLLVGFCLVMVSRACALIGL